MANLMNLMCFESESSIEDHESYKCNRTLSLRKIR
jgi:hypothetical protein